MKKERTLKICSPHDLINLTAKTDPQRRLIRSYIEDQCIVADGSAGTGKTLISLYLAFDEILKGETGRDHIKIIRSPVASKDQGFLPGTLEEKQMYYETPYKDITSFIFGGKPTAYDHLKKSGHIDFMTTSFVRGLTWDNSVIIVDECQNMMFHELNTIVTRVGYNSKIIFIGDKLQCDLFKKHEESGWDDFLQITDMMSEFDHVVFTVHDVVRSRFVKSWIHATENYHNRK